MDDSYTYLRKKNQIMLELMSHWWLISIILSAISPNLSSQTTQKLDKVRKRDEQNSD